MLDLIKSLTTRGFKPNYWVLDNECAKIIKDLFHEMKIDYQLVAAGTHRCNIAERAIQTFKVHLIAGILGVDSNFPMHLWDTLLEQCDITLNMLRASRIHPQISANDALNGTFNFNATPLGPVGCRVVAHIKPDKRQTYDPAGMDGFNIGPCMEHYRCHKIFLPKTRGFRICDTVEFFPQHSKITPETLQQQIERKLSELLKICTHTVDKFSKPLDRQLKLLEDVIPDLPMQSEIIENNNSNAKNLTSPDLSKRTIAIQKGNTKETPLVKHKAHVSIPVPIMHIITKRMQ